MTKHTILFLAANPRGTIDLALGREARAIQEELERSDCRTQFELVTRWAAQPLDLLRELRRLKPTIVHFSGYGGARKPRERSASAGPRRDIVPDTGALGGDDEQHGLFFQGPDGQPQLVSTAALEQTFGAAASSVKLVVLSACYSESQAQALLAHVDCVVGMRGAISDDAARNFAIGFYGGLGESASVAGAYYQGRAAISLEGLPDGERPQLKVRDSVDAHAFVLSRVRPNVHRGEPHIRVASSPSTSSVGRSGPKWLAAAAPAGLALGVVVWAVVSGKTSSPSPGVSDATFGGTTFPLRRPTVRGLTVLWVDNHPENNVRERSSLESLGVRIILAGSNNEALEMVRRQPPDLIISDMKRHRELVAGYALLDSLRQSGTAIPVVIYSGSKQPERVAEARRLGAVACTNDPAELFNYVLAALGMSPWRDVADRS